MLLTLQRLQDLAVGDKMVVYVGNLEHDIARCDKASLADAGAPTYKAVLLRLQEGLNILHGQGKITVTRRERQPPRTSSRGKPLDWRDYVYEVTKLG